VQDGDYLPLPPSVVQRQLKKLDSILTKDVPAFNKFVKDQDVPALTIKTSGPANPQ